MNLAQLIQSQNFARLLQALDAGNELTAGKTVQARLLSLDADGFATAAIGDARITLVLAGPQAKQAALQPGATLVLHLEAPEQPGGDLRATLVDIRPSTGNPPPAGSLAPTQLPAAAQAPASTLPSSGGPASPLPAPGGSATSTPLPNALPAGQPPAQAKPSSPPVAGPLLERVCAAHVYTALPDGSVQVQAAACLECGTCLAVAPAGVLRWHYPRGGYGIAFREG